MKRFEDGYFAMMPLWCFLLMNTASMSGFQAPELPRVLYLLTLGLLIGLLGFMSYRLVRILFREWRTTKGQDPPKRNLLVEALREQTLKEQEARRVSDETILAFEALNRLHRTTIRYLPIGISVLNLDGIVQYANPRFVTLLGVPDLAGSGLERVAPSLFEAVTQWLEGKKPGERLLYLSQNGQDKRVRMTLNRLPETRILLSLTDVTQIHALEERLRYKRELELMGELASGITHEVKNALATIQAQVQMLAYGRVEENSRKILAEVERLAALVREFMRSSQTEIVNPVRLPLRDWLTQLQHYWFQHPLGDRVEIDPPEDPQWAISGDQQSLTMVVNNLILNGLQACEDSDPDRPHVRVWVEDNEENFKVVVSDRGPGFSEPILKKMFVPFITSKEKGSGLGLFHCRKIVMAHQGQIEVEHQPPTRIICFFPKETA